jgi:glycine betaine/proline transport system substrate-binding protein
MRSIKQILAPVLVLLIVSGAAFAGGAAEEQTANLTYVNWEEGVAWTHLAAAILEDEMGYEVNLTAADVGPAYAAVAAGDQDAFMEAWLPGLHATYMEQYGDSVIQIGVIYEDAVSGLVVPQYMADDGVTTLSDLTDPEVVERLGGQIIGIDAGAGLMITTEEQAMPAYGLREAGLELIASSGPAMMAELDAAYQEEEYIVVLGWQPHSKFGYYDLVVLEQDQEQIWDIDDIYLIGRQDLRDDKPELAAFLENMRFTTEEIGDLMVHIAESNLSTLEAAREWKNANPGIWEGWIPN